jgi:hypothetical protein
MIQVDGEFSSMTLYVNVMITVLLDYDLWLAEQRFVIQISSWTAWNFGYCLIVVNRRIIEVQSRARSLSLLFDIENLMLKNPLI